MEQHNFEDEYGFKPKEIIAAITILITVIIFIF